MQDAGAEDVRRESMKVLEAGAEGGGLVLTAAGGFGVRTPDENVLAMREAVERHAAARGRRQ
jgi:uroporphyrinogen-III decarboxylase